MFIQKGDMKHDQSQHEELRCRLHSEKITGFEIGGLQALDEQKIILKAECRKCELNQTDLPDRIQASISDINCLIQLGAFIKSTSEKPPSCIDHLKAQVSIYLRSKYLRKVKYVSFYSLLTDFNKDFLSANSERPQTISKTDVFQKGVGFRQLMKDPLKFQLQANLTANQKNLRIIIDTKHNLIKSLKTLQKLFNQVGLKVLSSKFFIQVINTENSIFSEIIKQIVQFKSTKNAREQAFALQSILCMVKNETSIKDINSYMTKYINLFKSVSFWSQKIKFKVTPQILQDFCLNIQKTTVVLKNPNLLQSKRYESARFQDEFLYINEGQFIYKNEYRPNAFCEDKIDLQRDQNTMIGSQFFAKDFSFEQTIHSGKMIQIQKGLSSGQNIRLKLRLNANEIDCISIRITGSSSMQMFFEEKKEQFANFDLKIIPDEGDNFQVFGFAKPHQICRKDGKVGKVGKGRKFNFEDEQLMVLEDDVISFYLNEDQNKVICWNETRKALLWNHPIQRKSQHIFKDFEIQFDLYVEVVLYSTIPEIEIFEY